MTPTVGHAIAECPTCERNQDALRMAMEEHSEVAGEQQDRIDGLLRVVAAYREVAVQRMRGFVLHCPSGGSDVWLKGSVAEPAGELHCRVVWEINDAYREAVNQ